jgi:hypothetical protein
VLPRSAVRRRWISSCLTGLPIQGAILNKRKNVNFSACSYLPPFPYSLEQASLEDLALSWPKYTSLERFRAWLEDRHKKMGQAHRQIVIYNIWISSAFCLLCTVLKRGNLWRCQTFVEQQDNRYLLRVVR